MNRFAQLLAAITLLLSPLPLCAQIEVDSEQAREVKTLVERAASLIERKGRFAFDEFRVKGGAWFSGDSYVTVDTIDAVVLCYPPNPALEGTDVMDLKDKAGKVLHREMQSIAWEKGAGWLTYMWPKPGQTEPSKKWSYIKRVRVGEQDAWVGSGFYPEE
jgi:cytochrome c